MSKAVLTHSPIPIGKSLRNILIHPKADQRRKPTIDVYKENSPVASFPTYLIKNLRESNAAISRKHLNIIATLTFNKLFFLSICYPFNYTSLIIKINNIFIYFS